MIGPNPPTITMPAGSYTTQWDTTEECCEEGDSAQTQMMAAPTGFEPVSSR
jgi:hypothetical protein